MMYMMSKTIMYLICACDINDHVIPYPKYTTIIKPGQLVNAYNLMRVHVCTMISLISTMVKFLHSNECVHRNDSKNLASLMYITAFIDVCIFANYVSQEN